MIVMNGRAPLAMQATVEFGAVYPEDGAEAYWVVQLFRPGHLTIECYVGESKVIAQSVYNALTAAE